MYRIETVDAWEVLDSRGDPTVRVRVKTPNSSGVFTVPAGASTGTHEVVEVRDGGARYGGRGVQTAVAAVQDELAPLVVGREVTEQAAIDTAVRDCDGTPDLSRLGGNAVLGVSGAVAHAAAAALDRPLYAYLGGGPPYRLPMPMVNIISGGQHAPGGLAIQDILAVPVGADSYSEAIEIVWAVRAAVKEHLVDAGHRPLVADEGGFSPPLDGIDAAFDIVIHGIEAAGYRPSHDVALAVDVAATHFFDANTSQYELPSLDRLLSAHEMITVVESWIDDWPIVAIEDPLGEDDWDAWRDLTDRVGASVQVIGDDLLVTNRSRLTDAISEHAANAVLVKPNQTGTITRAIDVIRDAHAAGWGTVVSARSGETCDTTIADLAVGLAASQIKIGSLARSERLAKYNRLLAIERSSDAEFTTAW